MIANQGIQIETVAVRAAHTMPSLEINGFWYLATPYSKYGPGLYAAFLDACDAAGRLLSERGIKTYSPIAECHAIAQTCHLDPRDEMIWVPFLAPKIAAAHGLLVVKMPGWDESKGVTHEIAEFKRQGKPVHYLEWPSLDLIYG